MNSRSGLRKFFSRRQLLDKAEALVGTVCPHWYLDRLARRVYSYHNLGTGTFPEGEERTPYGAGERYNYDRMYMLASNYDFTAKSVLDIGCNSGWFCFQCRQLGSGPTLGVDCDDGRFLGGALRYAMQYERTHRFGVRFFNQDISKTPLEQLPGRAGVARFDVVILFSVLHHIHEESVPDRAVFFQQLRQTVTDVIFYEDHEFWNEMYDDQGKPIPVQGSGYRFGWNKDLSWQRKLGGLERYEERILDAWRQTWRAEVLKLEDFAAVRFLGFSEKRRPVFALYLRETGAAKGSTGA